MGLISGALALLWVELSQSNNSTISINFLQKPLVYLVKNLYKQ